MSLAEFVGFLVLTAAAAYAGFAFGLITMAGVGLTGLLSLADAAMIVSILSMVNSMQILLKGWRNVSWSKNWLVMATSVPLLFIGYWLLQGLAGTRADLLRRVLGFVIIVSSLQLARKLQPLAKPSSGWSFLFFGAIAGVMGGMFSTAGPPLVYHFYRQPMSLVMIRETPVTVFAVSALVRIGLVTVSGDLPSGSTWSGLFAIPVVIATTHAARRWPPPFSPATMRHIVFVLLFLSGVSLDLPAVFHLFGGLR